MINFSPNDKKNIAFLILLFTVILLIVVIDLFLNAKMFEKSASEIAEPTVLEKEISNIKNSPKNATSSMIRRGLINFFGFMNNKEYNKAFSLLSDDFKKDSFDNNVENFVKFMNKYYPGKYSPYFSKFEQYENKYGVEVSFLPISNTDSDVINSTKAEKIDTFFISFTDKNSYCFSFNNYVGEKLLGTEKKNSDFSVILDRTVLYEEKSEFYFTVTNNTDKVISLDSKNVFCYTGFKPRYYSGAIDILPHSSSNFVFSVETGLSISNALPKEILFNDVLVNDNTYSFSIETDYAK